MNSHRLYACIVVLIASVAHVNAQPPTISAPFPMGVQRGTTFELNLAGTNLAEPTGVLCSFPVKVTIPTDSNNGKDNAKLMVRIETPRDVPLGFHSLRVVTTRGVSNFRLFCVDDLPQVNEVDTNRSLPTAQVVTPPCVVCGRTDPEVMDYFKFRVNAGQRLSFEMLGRRLGSNLDPQLTLIDLKNGKSLAFSDDSPGQGKDPRISFTFKDAGEYAVEVRDVRHQGGADWFYRLRIGDFPLATAPVPLAVKRGTTTQVSFAGPHVEGLAPVTVIAPADPSVQGISIWPTSAPVFPNATSGLPGWPVTLRITDMDETVEAEPNDDPTKPNRVPVPCAVNARFLRKGDKDHFVMTLKKGQRVLIDAQTQEFHSPTSVYMVLKDAKAAQVAASNPATDPAKIDFTAPADGDFTLMVEHLHYWGSPEEAYHLTIQSPEPGFTLSATSDRFDVAQGGASLIMLNVVRRDFTGPIDISVAGPAHVTGATTIAAGQNAAMLLVTAAADAPVGGHRLNLIAKATINNKPVVEAANVEAIVKTALNNTPFPPKSLSNDLAVAVTEKTPFSFQIKYDTAEGVRGLSVPVTITATKAMGFDEEITITTQTLPPAQGQQPPLPAATAKIAKGQKEVKLELKPAANAPLGAVPIGFVAKAKVGAKEYTTVAPLTPLTLALPFELQVNTQGGKFTADSKHKIKVTAVRKGGYKGPIGLEVRNLPANVTAAKVNIAENTNEIEIELSAAANATVGDKADVNILGTATGAANQTNASANFTLSVGKKP